MAARLVISPVVPAISNAFGVSNAAIGLALTGMWLAYAAAQFPSGLLADRYGERSIILVSVGVRRSRAPQSPSRRHLKPSRRVLLCSVA